MSDKTFLDRLPAEDRAALLSLLTVRDYERGANVILESDENTEIFFVLEGNARASIFSEEGRVVAYRDMGPGAIFGEIAAIDGQPRSANVVASEKLVVGRLPTSAFHELIETNSRFTWALLRHLVAQSRDLTRRVFEFSTMLVRDRLIHELLRLAGSEEDGERAELRPAPTHFELAARISTHREAVSREMAKLSKRGLVSKQSGALILHDLDALRAFTEEG